MQSMKVKDHMVPLADYATVLENATLYEAVMALYEAQNRFTQNRAKHRAVLVINKDNRVVGKLSLLDVLRGLEPQYKEIQELEHTTSTFTPDFIRSLLQKYSLWQTPLDDICRKAARIRVKDIMYVPREEEFIAEEATLNEAVHLLVMGQQQSLLVVSGDQVTGILRLSDIAEVVCDMIKACNL